MWEIFINSVAVLIKIRSLSATVNYSRQKTNNVKIQNEKYHLTKRTLIFMNFIVAYFR